MQNVLKYFKLFQTKNQKTHQHEESTNKHEQLAQPTWLLQRR